jgi:hypothetical protein
MSLSLSLILFSCCGCQQEDKACKWVSECVRVCVRKRESKRESERESESESERE